MRNGYNPRWRKYDFREETALFYFVNVMHSRSLASNTWGIIFSNQKICMTSPAYECMPLRLILTFWEIVKFLGYSTIGFTALLWAVIALPSRKILIITLSCFASSAYIEAEFSFSNWSRSSVFKILVFIAKSLLPFLKCFINYYVFIKISTNNFSGLSDILSLLKCEKNAVPNMFLKFIHKVMYRFGNVKNDALKLCKGEKTFTC